MTPTWSCVAAECRSWLRTLPDRSVDLIFGSPPYQGKGGRYKDLPDAPDFTCGEWVDFMLEVTREACRVCRGDVLWVVNGSVEGGCYVPAVEGLVWRWHEAGGRLDRPVVWHKNAPPGRRDWFTNDWEFILCFPGDTRTWNWQSVATPPKFKAGGRFRQRDAKGNRRPGGAYPRQSLTRPRDVLRVTVGGGHMGHGLAHRNEAPFPVKLAEPFVKALTDAGGTVCDPFCGSGSTAQAALQNGRNFVGCDLRPSQVELCRERLTSLGFVCEST